MEARLLERGKSSGRSDDNAAAIKKRFVTYRAETLPVVGYYSQLGLVHAMDGSRPVEDVYDETQKALRAIHKADSRRRGEVRLIVQLYAADRSALESWLGSAHGRAHEAALHERLGAGAPAVRARCLEVAASAKPYGLDSLRAFD